jgi:protein-disulfide isomerase
MQLQLHAKPRYFTLLSLSLILLLLSVPTLAQDAAADSAPDISVEAYPGAGDDAAATFDLSDYAGQVVLVHFWATWAPASWGDAAILSDFSAAYPSVNVVGINHFDPLEAALDYIEVSGVEYPVAPDADGSIAASYGITSFPSTVIVNPDGEIQQVIDRPLTESILLGSLLSYVDVQTPDVIEAPIPAKALTRYDGLQVSTTEAGYYVLGNPTAGVIIEDYSSVSCPFCRNFHNQSFFALLDLIHERAQLDATENVAFVYVPIHITGNVPNGFEANTAALCAGEQGAFFEYIDVLFDWHTRYEGQAFDEARLRQGIVNMGLDADAYDECVSSERMASVLETAVDQMRDEGYTGTPTIVVNGDTVSATFERIEAAINRITGNRI